MHTPRLLVFGLLATLAACSARGGGGGGGTSDSGTDTGQTTPPTDNGQTTPPTDTGNITPTDTGQSDPCQSARDCGECTGRSQCGWCAGSCHVGTGAGPSGFNCGGTRWAWTSSACDTTPPPQDAGQTTGPVSNACISCTGSACPDEGNACLNDAACSRCLSQGITADCFQNPVFLAVAACTCQRCPEPCGPYCPR